MSAAAKRRAAVLAATLGIMLAATWLYGQIYSIEADNSNLAPAAKAWLSRGSSYPTVYTVEPQKTLDIGRQRFALAELGDGVDLYLSLFRLERGLNGRYKIVGSGYGGGSFRSRVVREGTRMYYLLGGRNFTLGVASAAFTMKDEVHGPEIYQMEIPAGDYFLTVREIDAAFSANHEEPGSLRLYDGAGSDITEQANL